MKKIFILLAFIISCTAFLLSSCAPTKEIAAKSGAQLWGENCNRCHNAPAVGEFSNAQWDIIGSHMKLRANLIADETTKIIAYLSGTGR